MLRTVRKAFPRCNSKQVRTYSAMKQWLALVALMLVIGLLQQSTHGLLAQEGDVTSSPQANSSDVEQPLAESPSEAAPVQSTSKDSRLFLPMVAQDFDANLADRLGFGTSVSSINVYPEIRSLKAGWYVDWRVNRNAARPAGIEYVPMVRMHQTVSCGNFVMPDRSACPYVEPYEYTYSPNAASITSMAQANPGLTWLLGNEMDRLDWPGGGQDEMLPELYAEAYHELYNIIKAADPTAKVAIGGIIQATPLRLEYLTTVWDTYQSRYGEEMPVDIWNVHAFIAGELCQWERPDGGERVLRCYGAGVPPGATEKQGAYIGEDWKHIDRVTFDEQIRAFRSWMKERGQQQKPLIVTEYGVLYTSVVCNNTCPDPDQYNLQDPNVVHGFMLWTFDYFMDTKDCDLGYAADDCRLVQRWAWFSLEDVEWEFNPHTVLFDRDSKAITDAGRKYRDYAEAMISSQP